MKEIVAVKKPSKKERLLAKRAQREQMLKVDMSMNVTLECPKCHVQQIMSLEEYFQKINYGSPFQKVLRCDSCAGRPSLQFYKANRKQIAQAGFNWERRKQGISDEEMMKKLEQVDEVRAMIKGEAGDLNKGNRLDAIESYEEICGDEANQD